MNIQKSFEDESIGKLYIVPTPIGNLEDITYRALKVLRSVELIAAEDTRNTRKLLNYFEINVPLISYHEHNKESREHELIEKIRQNESIAVVSDAGMPAISDPGYELVQAAIAANLDVIVLPGANAALCALVGSGLPSIEFYFYGFLPRKKKDKLAELERLSPYQATLIVYESPYRIKETLSAIYEQLGNRNVAIARELTKRFEEYVRGTAKDVLNWAQATELKGEFCIIIEGNQSQMELKDEVQWWEKLSLDEHVTHYMNKNDMYSKEAIKQVAVDRKIPKREVYQAYHIKK